MRLRSIIERSSGQSTEEANRLAETSIPVLPTGTGKDAPGSAQLLGSIARALAEAVNLPALRFGHLLEAGFTPFGIAAGLNREQQPVARHVLLRIHWNDGLVARFAERLPETVGEHQEDGSLFLPADFAPDDWLRAARETPHRAISALVAWAQQTMTLEAVVRLAREVAGPGDGSLDRLACSLERWRIAFVPGRWALVS